MAKFFNGSDANLRPNCTEYSAMDFTGAFTACVWLKTSASPAGAVVLAKWGATGQYLILHESGKFRFYIKEATVSKTAVTASTYNDDTWHHIAGVFDATNVIIKVDAGTVEDVTGDAATSVDNTTNAFVTGQYSSGGTASSRFHGALAHLALYDRALTNAELKSVMFRGPQSVEGLVLFFPLMTEPEHNLAPESGKTAVSSSSAAYSFVSGPPVAMYGIDSPYTDGGELPATPLTLEVADTLSLSDSASLINYIGLALSDTLSFSDGLSLLYSGEAAELLIGVNSFSSLWADAATFELAYLLGVSDTISLSDAATTSTAIAIEAYDTLFYDLLDSVATGGLNSLSVTASDTLALSDSVTVTNFNLNLPISTDTLNLMDFLELRLNYFLPVSDTVALVDASANFESINTSFTGDALALSDAASTALLVTGSASSADTLALSDDIRVLMNTNLSNYLRRYLNDVN